MKKPKFKSEFINRDKLCSRIELKEEAIKWIKYIQEDIDNATYWDAISYRKQEWIMTFFNLTEEDLK